MAAAGDSNGGAGSGSDEETLLQSPRRRRRFRADGADDVPVLVRLLAGNPATSAAILSCLDTVDASRLRQLHPAVIRVVAGVPWADMGTVVVDVVLRCRQQWARR